MQFKNVVYICIPIFIGIKAGVVELVDTLDLGSSAARCGSSSLKELGISRSVVSFVLNGKNKEMRISDELTKKVLDLVETRNYQANHIAKSLKTGKTHTIGLIVADIANPFFAKIASEIEKEVRKKGYSVFFCSF